jgi:chromosome segregation ATPase
MDGDERIKKRREGLQLEGSELADVAFIIQRKVKSLKGKKGANPEIIRILERDLERLKEKREPLNKRLDEVARRRKR